MQVREPEWCLLWVTLSPFHFSTTLYPTSYHLPFIAGGQEIQLSSVWSDVNNPSQAKCGAFPVGKRRKPVAWRRGNHRKKRKSLCPFLSLCWMPLRVVLLSHTPRQAPSFSGCSHCEKACSFSAPQSRLCLEIETSPAVGPPQLESWCADKGLVSAWRFSSWTPTGAGAAVILLPLASAGCWPFLSWSPDRHPPPPTTKSCSFRDAFLRTRQACWTCLAPLWGIFLPLQGTLQHKMPDNPSHPPHARPPGPRESQTSALSSCQWVSFQTINSDIKGLFRQLLWLRFLS